MRKDLTYDICFFLEGLSPELRHFVVIVEGFF